MGLIFIVISLGLAKWQIYDPLHAAAEGRKQVWIHSSLLAAAIALGPYGILLLLFGRKPNDWFKIDPENINWKNALFLGAFALFGLGVYIYIDRQLALQGYR